MEWDIESKDFWGSKDRSKKAPLTMFIFVDKKYYYQFFSQLKNTVLFQITIYFYM